jgi:hypothetical protein
MHPSEGIWRVAASGKEDWAYPLTLARAVVGLSDTELQDIDEYQLDAYLQSVPRVLETAFVPLVNMLGELLKAAFGGS